ncbi:S-adenosyl-L-methionine-dependentmethyltransferases superfamily protein [Striga asiatica]|uniref:S-adenosyl-L-methionine-dependentmethyltransferases superfamily protein n=1 Tax=Striga asiatica TaxID=4170 RepID=A0A5A7QR81_STRAF|nr:S-adenosyl-L-methionine-dependentmethyltransferases superfamily protein [Striga asiatica]
MKRKRSNQNLNLLQSENQSGSPKISKSDKTKKKRKIKKAEDLQFEAADELAAVGSRRKEHFGKQERKKHKLSKSDEDIEFRGREEIKFGDIAFKTAQDAWKERLRLQAVDAYRQRKGWASRPGVKILPSIITSSL